MASLMYKYRPENSLAKQPTASNNNQSLFNRILIYQNINFAPLNTRRTNQSLINQSAGNISRFSWPLYNLITQGGGNEGYTRA